MGASASAIRNEMGDGGRILADAENILDFISRIDGLIFAFICVYDLSSPPDIMTIKQRDIGITSHSENKSPLPPHSGMSEV